jgi:carbamoyl-phosphate synthase large subunit
MQVKNKNKKINILVTGVGGPAGINILKLLKKYDKYFNLFGVDISSHSAGQFMSHQFFICERVSDEKKYLQWTNDFIKKHKIEVVIPTVAEELVLMEKLKKIIDSKIKIIVSDHEVLEICDEKDRLYKWMSEKLPNYMGNWVRLNSKKIFPAENYFIKPVKGRGSRGCRLVSKTELKHLLKTNKTEMKNFIAMEVLPGREWTVDCYVNSAGDFSYIVPRLRLGLSGGISQVGRTDTNKKVIETAREIFENLQKEKGNLSGPVFVQLKEDKNNIPKMVEVNPRASGGLPITALSGANIADCIFADLVKNTPLKNIKWKEVTVTRYFEEKVIKEKKVKKKK